MDKMKLGSGISCKLQPVGSFLQSKLTVLSGAPDVSLLKMFLLNIFSNLAIYLWLFGGRGRHICLKKNVSSRNCGAVERKTHDPYPSTKIQTIWIHILHFFLGFFLCIHFKYLLNFICLSFFLAMSYSLQDQLAES